MSLIVKLMGPEDVADSDTRKRFRLLSNVEAVSFGRDPDAYAQVTFSNGDPERFYLAGNVYVMNEGGKTVSTFGVEPPPGTPIESDPQPDLIDDGLLAMPYQLAAVLKRGAHAIHDTDLLERMNRLQVAVDA